jgi:Family of unknown function (DUF6879)
MSSSADFMGSFTHSAWRLEALPQYNPRTDASYRHFVETGEVLPFEDRPGKQEWMRLVAEAVAQGKRLGRVRIVGQPLADGERWELAVFGENAEAGEDVRIADRIAHPELAELTGDFWLLDDETDRPVAQLMTYDPDGQYVSREVTSDPTVIARCRAQRDRALARSVDLKEFLQEASERLR